MRNTWNPVDRHQVKIARDTLRMSDAGARIMGGMSKEEAIKVLQRLAPRDAELLDTVKAMRKGVQS